MVGAVKPYIIYILIIALFLLYITLISGRMPHNNSTHSRDNGEKQKPKTVPIERSDCKKHKSFAFIKTHKTGSSTMSNILLRYTESKHLNQLQGKFKTDTKYNDLRSHIFPPTPDGARFHAFVMHADYNYPFLRKKLDPMAKFFTIIRHPVSRYLSAFNFFEVSKSYDKNDFNHAIQLHMEENSGYMKNTSSCVNCNYVVDSVAADLGFKFKDYYESEDKEGFIDAWLKVKDTELDFVLLTEHFDLSLVLLARKMCWNVHDVAYLKSLESIGKPEVTEETKEKVLNMQTIDAKIYGYYDRIFWERVNREEGIMEEVEELQRINKEMAGKCIGGRTKVPGMDAYELELSPFGKSNFTCKAMAMRVRKFGFLIQMRDQGLREAPDLAEIEGDYLTLQDLYDLRYGESS